MYHLFPRNSRYASFAGDISVVERRNTARAFTTKKAKIGSVRTALKSTPLILRGIPMKGKTFAEFLAEEEELEVPII